VLSRTASVRRKAGTSINRQFFFLGDLEGFKPKLTFRIYFLSLLVLGQVITALTTPYPPGSSHVHVPYRESKLTRLLQDSLSGHARIAVICTVSLEEQHAEQALGPSLFVKSFVARL
jgi:hypothetical protein